MPLILAVYVFIVFGFRSKQYVFVEPRNEAHETAEGMVAHTGSPPFTTPSDFTVWGFFLCPYQGHQKGYSTPYTFCYLCRICVPRSTPHRPALPTCAILGPPRLQSGNHKFPHRTPIGMTCKPNSCRPERA